MDMTEMVPSGAAGVGSGTVVPYDPVVGNPAVKDIREPEDDATAAAKGELELWTFWSRNIAAALVHERRWRQEAEASERMFFGPDEDEGQQDPEDAAKSNKITDKVGLIHANIEVLKPMLYSETPTPLVRRRFTGDGKAADYTDLMAAEAAQRLALYILDTEDFDGAVERARDDWLIAGRGTARAIYKATFETVAAVDPLTGEPVETERKADERACPRSVEWKRCLFAPCETWDALPWMAFETPMTRSAIAARFGEEIAGRMAFNTKGLIDSSRGISDSDRQRGLQPVDETGEPAISPFDTAMVWEIWNRDDKTVIWWSAAYQHGVLDKSPDTLGLEKFWPMPRPLLATVKGDRLTPRPDIRYYEGRAEEVKIASDKLRSILKTISISGLFPGAMQEEVKKLLNGDNLMIPVESWLKLMDKGGTANIIQWLPLQQMVAAAQALVLMREQAKQAMFEASGISDIMRSQGDPTETATAQNLKGQYANLRLRGRQRRMALFALDLLRIMIEIALEHFDTARLAEITGLDFPMTKAEREAIIAQNQLLKQAFAEAMAQHQSQVQAVQQAGQQVQQAGPEAQQGAAPVLQAAAQQIGEPPQPPVLAEEPKTSWEAVHARLRSDFGRKVTLSIETQSTILTGEAEDKQARVEFIQAFAGFVQALAPMMGSGLADLKMVKELLLFGVRGFPKSRTLETLISDLPDEAPQKQEQEAVQVTVAKIRAEVDKMLEDMRMADAERERQHEVRLKGVELLVDAQKMKAAPPPEPPRGE